jgi:hypothetical protein
LLLRAFTLAAWAIAWRSGFTSAWRVLAPGAFAPAAPFTRSRCVRLRSGGWSSVGRRICRRGSR